MVGFEADFHSQRFTFVKKNPMRILCISLLLSLGTSLFAQVKTASPAFLKEVASTTCECFELKLKNGQASDAQMAMGMCMISFINNNRAEAEENFGPIEYANVNTMTRIGEQVGVEMAAICPETMMTLVEESGGIEEVMDESTFELAGSIKSIDFGFPTVVTITEESGRPVKCYWMEYFTGSEVLTEESAIGKEVKIAYQNQDFFSGDDRDYQTRRVITGLIVK